MSHITKVKTQLKDDRALKKALSCLGYNISESIGFNPAEYHSFTARKKGEKLNFIKTMESDLYSISADWYTFKRKQKTIINEITQVYSREKIVSMANSRGYSVIRNNINSKGQIEMVIRKVAERRK